MTGNMKSGGHLLVEALKLHGVKHVFCVPGESYLPVLDALYDTSEIALTVCRQEGGAAMMADAYGKLTGEPGICMVTRAPGATNASAGLHIAQQDSTPMILFVGQVGRGDRDREAFQEVDYRRFLGQVAKWVAEIDSAERIPEYLARAFVTATSGRPGPVVLSLPEDVLTEMLPAPTAQPWRRVVTYPGAGQLEELRGLLEKAERPFVIAGGGGWTQTGVQGLQAFAEAWDLPVGCSFRRQDRFDNRHDHYAGDIGIGPNPKLAQRVKDADLLILLGGRMGEMASSNYTLLSIPSPKQKLVHIHGGAEELGRVYQPALAINATPGAFAEALAAVKPSSKPRWATWRAEARADYLAWSEPTATDGPLQLGEIVRYLNKALPEDAILCNGAGNYSIWHHRFFRFRRFATQLAPTSGSMGYGVPGAVAAKRAFPNRTVIAWAGDGCFMMTCQEFATAVQYKLPIVVLLVNKGTYGTIRMHQERHFPGRVVATDLVNPDFAKLADAYGGFGQVVTKTEDFAPAFERALAAGKPSIIELRLAADVINPRETLTSIRAGAVKKSA